jgi:hypothetical protein
MVNVLEQAEGCTDVRRSGGKTDFSATFGQHFLKNAERG